MNRSNMLSPPTRERVQRYRAIGMRCCILFIVLCCTIGASLYAQRKILLGAIDTSGYPIVRGEVYFPDGNDVQECAPPFSALHLQENGVDCPIIDRQCSPYGASPRLSSLLLIDRSTSMSDWDPEFRLIRWGGNYWVDALLGNGGSACALALFDASPWLACDFTRDTSKLRAGINALDLGVDTTSYATAFLEQSYGAISLLRGRTGRRLVLLLTDGGGWGTEEAIIRRAEEADVVIFAIVVGRAAGGLLRSVAVRTGGRCFDSITTPDEMRRAIFTIITATIQPAGCRISWQSRMDCSSNRAVTISCSPSGVSGEASYSAPIDRTTAVVADPQSIAFGGVDRGGYRDTMLLLSVEKGGAHKVTVHEVRIRGEDSSAFALDAGPLPFTLAPGEQHSLQLRFAPRVIGRSVAQLCVEHDGSCLRTTIELQGQGVGGAVSIPLLHGAPGDRLRIPLLLDAPHTNRRGRDAMGFIAIFGFNPRLLVIGDSLSYNTMLYGDTLVHGAVVDSGGLGGTTSYDSTPRDLPRGEGGSYKTAAIKGSWDGAGDTLLWLGATAALADTTTTQLEIIDFHWLDANGAAIAGDVVRRNGLFTLDGICFDGGRRLVEEAGPSWLRIAPTNQTAASPVMLAFRSNEDGRITIALDDRSGRRVAVLFDDVVRSQQLQSLTIKTAGLPSGIYRCTMQSATQSLGLWVVVVR